MAKITPQQYEPAFDIAKAMREGRFNRSQALERMVEDGFSKNSAVIYLNSLIAMPRGEVYQKTINNDAARYYLQRFMDEMTATEFAAVIQSVAWHIRYYDSKGPGKQRELADILVEFQTRAEVYYGQAFDDALLLTKGEVTHLRVVNSDEQIDNVADSGMESVFHEGAVKTIELTVHERAPAARRACIAHFGPICQICDFDFERTYGELGRGFIHVHHRADLALGDDVREGNPITDLLPVCPNCHAMLHTETPAMSPEHLKALIKLSNTNYKND